MIKSIWKKVGNNGYELTLNSGKVLLSKLRNKKTKREEFIRSSNRLVNLLLELALSEQPVSSVKEISPTGTEYDHYDFENQKICLVPILRSGEAISNLGRLLTKDVAIASILIQRNEESEKKEPIFLYKKIPKDIKERTVFLVDPMLGTGGSSIRALECLEEEGVGMEDVVFVNIVSCPEGLENLYARYPGVKVYTASVDPILNEDKYIVPGLGDFGDRYYGTE